MRILFAGTPAVAVPSLDALTRSGHELIGVLTRPDAPRGRGKRTAPSPVAVRAAELGLEVLRPERPRDPAFLARLAELAPDCCPVVAYGALLPQTALDLVPQGWINLHFSLLPRWRGAAPVQRAVLAGDDLTGATTFRIVAELDAGPTFDTITEPVGPADSAGDLLNRLSHRGAELLVRTLDAIAAGTQPEPQPAEGVTLAAKLTGADAGIDWTQPATAVDRLIRACTPAPGAWTTRGEERLKLGPVNPTEGTAPPGELLVSKDAVRVGTGAGLVQLGWVQPPGRRPMPAADWARGALRGATTLGA